MKLGETNVFVLLKVLCQISPWNTKLYITQSTEWLIDSLQKTICPPSLNVFSHAVLIILLFDNQTLDTFCSMSIWLPSYEKKVSAQKKNMYIFWNTCFTWNRFERIWSECFEEKPKVHCSDVRTLRVLNDFKDHNKASVRLLCVRLMSASRGGLAQH